MVFVAEMKVFYRAYETYRFGKADSLGRRLIPGKSEYGTLSHAKRAVEKRVGESLEWKPDTQVSYELYYGYNWDGDWKGEVIAVESGTNKVVLKKTYEKTESDRRRKTMKPSKTGSMLKKNPERITQKWLDARLERLNKMLGRPIAPWTKTADGKYKANIGNLHFDSANGGLMIHEMESDGGGVNTYGGRYTKREMDTFLTGLLTGVDLAQYKNPKMNPQQRAKPPVSRRKRNPAKYYQVFRCKGNELYWLRGFTAEDYEPRFTLTRGDAARYRSIKDAKFAAQGMELLRGWKIGVAEKGLSINKILEGCAGKA